MVSPQATVDTLMEESVGHAALHEVPAPVPEDWTYQFDPIAGSVSNIKRGRMSFFIYLLVAL
jgi:hypothetical protein